MKIHTAERVIEKLTNFLNYSQPVNTIQRSMYCLGLADTKGLEESGRGLFHT